jgi:hypothetical protein
MFCGLGIEASRFDPVEHVIRPSWKDPDYEGAEASYWCHANCLRSAAHESIPMYVVDPDV